MAKEKVIIILCDTLRARSLPHYGNERNTTPNLEPILSRDFTVFSRAYAPSPWTPPSHMSLFTGLYPSQVTDPDNSLQLHTVFTLLPELFKDFGYKTFAISTNELISKNLGYGKGFDTFMQLWLPDPLAEETIFRFQGKNDIDRIIKAVKMILSGHDKSEIVNAVRTKMYKRYKSILKDATPSTDRAMKLLKSIITDNKDSNLFCFVNLMQVHNTYNPPRATRGTLVKENKEVERNYMGKAPIEHYALAPFPPEVIEYMKLRYEEEILYLDIVLADFLKYLKEINLYNDCTIIITSDHGEHFGENGHVAHAFSLYEPLIRIPMYIKWRGKESNNQRINNKLTMLHDLYSTFLTILGHWHPYPDSSVDITSSERRSWVLSQLPDMSSNVIAAKKRRASFSLSDIGLDNAGLSSVIFESGCKIIKNGSRQWTYDLEKDHDELALIDSVTEQMEQFERISRDIA